MNDESKRQATGDRRQTTEAATETSNADTSVHRLIEGEDFYREGAMIVFTARYHLRRGYCCGSGCRHCPYDEAATRAAVVAAKSVDDEELSHRKEGARGL